jgi:hypothetical protein
LKKRTRLLIGIGISVILIGHYFWLMWLFPNVTLAIIGVFPSIIIIINLGTIGGIYAISGVVKQKSLTIFICIIVVIAVSLLQIVTYPMSEGVLRLSHEYWNAFWEYPNKITYIYLAFGNEAETTAATIKYADNLPEKILYIKIVWSGEDHYVSMGEYTLVDSFTIELKDGRYEYDTTYMKVETADNSTSFIVHPGETNMQEWKIKSNLSSLFNANVSDMEGYNRYVISYDTIGIAREFHSGIDKILAFSINHFK